MGGRAAATPLREGGGDSVPISCRLLGELGGGNTEPCGGECRSTGSGVVPPPTSPRVCLVALRILEDELVMYSAERISRRRAVSRLGAVWARFWAFWRRALLARA